MRKYMDVYAQHIPAGVLAAGIMNKIDLNVVADRLNTWVYFDVNYPDMMMLDDEISHK